MAGNGHASQLWKGDAPFVAMMRRLLETPFLLLKDRAHLPRRFLFEAPFSFSQGEGVSQRRTPICDGAEVIGLVQQNPQVQFCTLTVQGSR
jgi:energy-coupling factor transporter ATP-binding protein EcfA2